MALANLSPSRQSGKNNMPVTVERYFVLIPLRQNKCFGAWANPAHFAPKYINDLRKFVYPGSTKKVTD